MARADDSLLIPRQKAASVATRRRLSAA